MTHMQVTIDHELHAICEVLTGKQVSNTGFTTNMEYVTCNDCIAVDRMVAEAHDEVMAHR